MGKTRPDRRNTIPTARAAATAGPPDGAVRISPRLLGLLLFLLVAGAFLPALRNAFIYYDDPGFVTDNPHVRDGFTWAGVRWAFGSADLDYWRPLSWLSHMLDCQLYGAAAWGHHLSSVLLHAINAVLVFVVFRIMTGATWRSLLVAALFGLHPLHVESVAWIAERKDVLCTCFGLLTLAAYVRGVRLRTAGAPGGLRWHALALGAFALALMSKPMLVTLPFVLLLLDYWPLARLGDGRPRAACLWALLREKIPFFILAAAVGVLTVLAQGQVGALKSAASYPWSVRLANAVLAYGSYLGKSFVPTGLAVFYPYRFYPPLAAAVLTGGLLVAVTGAVVGLGRRRPYLPVGWIWFLGTLVPVIGLIQVGEQAMADRYTYFPLIGVFVMVAWLAGEAAARWPAGAKALAALAGVAVAACALLSGRQLGYWRDSTRLFRHALAVTRDNWAAHTYLGYALARDPGQLPNAIAEYRAALRLAPGMAVTHNYLADALVKTPGGLPEARAEFEAALRLNPGLADAHNNLATILAQTPGREAEAVAEYRAALRLRPASPEMHYNLGLVLARTDALPAAVAEFQTALRLRPDYPEAHFALGFALGGMPGRAADAMAQYEAAIRQKPDYADAHFNLGLLLAADPARRATAEGEFTETLRLNPRHEGARAMLERLRSGSP